MEQKLIIKNLGLADYLETWEAMRAFTDSRQENAHDELWLVQHPPVYTLGQAGKPEHLLQPSSIPLVKTDRGGQITYHGPGQLVAYPLIHIKRAGLGIKKLVCSLEATIIELLKTYEIQASRQENAPGVYVNDAKIAAVGLRIRRGCSYHGLSFNVNMDLTPFNYINPCGYQNLKITQTSLLGGPQSISEIIPLFISIFCKEFNYQSTAPCRQSIGYKTNEA